MPRTMCVFCFFPKTLSVRTSRQTQLNASASNAALVTVHASDCNSKIKRVVPSPITMALRRTAYTPGTVRQSVILVLYIYLSRVKCKIDIVQFCKLVRLSMGSGVLTIWLFKKGRFKAKTNSVHRLGVCCVYFVNIYLFIVKFKGNILID